MVDAVTPAARRPPFEAGDLRDEPRMIEQLDPAAVDERERVDVEIALRLVEQVVGDAVLAEQFARELAGEPVAAHADTRYASAARHTGGWCPQAENGGCVSRIASMTATVSPPRCSRWPMPR